MTGKNRLEEFDLRSIDYFLLVTTISFLADIKLLSKEFFVVDKKAKREKIYTNDLARGLRKSWEQAAKKLGQMTSVPAQSKTLDHFERPLQRRCE